MKLTYILIILTVCISVCCSTKEIHTGPTEVALPVEGLKTGCAFLTTDQHHVPVLSFTGSTDTSTALYFSKFDTVSNALSVPLQVTPSIGTGFHEESMNKVAFKTDGTIIAVWEMKHPVAENKYAGSILYSMSHDNGTSWTTAKMIHSDTLHSHSRSFFDITTLSDGEVGVVWLDSRHTVGTEGSSLYFAKTKDTLGFQQDQQIAETVCQCCRTEMFNDDQGMLHIAFRDIQTSVKGQVRDFAHITSTDNGATFTAPVMVSNDNWIIEGCPHTGASLTKSDNVLTATWFTAGGTSGVYFTTSKDNGITFQSRTLISASAHHPQITAANTCTYVVWDGVSSATGHHGHDSHQHSHSDSEGGITLATINAQQEMTTQPIDSTGSFPVIFANKSMRLIAYTRNERIQIRMVH